MLNGEKGTDDWVPTDYILKFLVDTFFKFEVNFE